MWVETSQIGGDHQRLLEAAQICGDYQDWTGGCKILETGQVSVDYQRLDKCVEMIRNWTSVRRWLGTRQLKNNYIVPEDRW